jgi:hypothetical protein
MTLTRAAVFVAVAILSGARPSAQSDVTRPDLEKMKIRLGPLFVNPTVTLGNVGADDNVFNDAAEPKHDLTMTLSPKTELWLPFLGSWFEGIITEDFSWYRQYSSERSANHGASLDWKLPLTRLNVDVAVGRTATRARPGFEIDARAHRVQTDYGAAASIWFLVNTAIDVSFKHSDTNYDEDVLFGDVNLRDELNGNVTTRTVGVSQKLTPLTTISAGFSQRQDRFTFNPLRDADSTEISGAVRFDPAALLKGSVSVGYNQFRPKSDALPSYTGTMLAADLSYAPAEVTKLAFRAERAIRYSYEDAQPYYLQTGFSGEITQQIFGPVDIVGRGGTATLDYRTRAGVVVPVADRSDRVTTYGVGVGYHLGKSVRIGFNADQNHRDSPLASRRYDRLTYGSSLTYDF